ncbi:streptococcal hemagglutinin protein [Jejuia pallidilutea]|uniref:Streptococcal hemagglutinin protein n=1 Tax=Jejuia pallidilutea TaxID=504487 RepID=A0A090WI99_9FLAO|nr:streptococcal hemagglutinin protein [Jejuia pallidilutea]GAL89786.1 streptococcal hemagglutinin protein [Jejuia pallidilutea]
MSFLTHAQVTLEREVKITHLAMYFNGDRVPITHTENSTTGYDFVYGRTLTPHGDCIKTYKNYVFMSWYRGGKEDRHVMLTRYNMETGAMKTIEFPHQHTGYRGRWWIGETHNTIAVAVSPINGTIHMVYDMHAYTNGGSFVNDYFRYSYSVENAADLPDEEFTLDKFVKDPFDGDYRHTTMDGVRNPRKYDRFTYPQFFLSDEGELFLTARDGTSHDGAQAFIKYDAAAKKWGDFFYFNALGAKSKGETHDWSIYGSMKYVDGKIRIGFQRRLRNGADKYNAQNGVYYAYSDDPTGASQWKNHKGEPITFPIVKAEEALVFEPGDSVKTRGRDMVHIVGGFDWTVTDNGDVHIISRVKDNENNVTKNFHSYKPASFNDDDDFIITSDFVKASNIYTSGNDVFVIGLNSSGRPFVDRTEGGTNAFTRVYEQTSGKRFTKGKVHIADGKLYYYLLETKPNNNDDVRTTYLQVIDLSFFSKPSELGVKLLNLSNNQSFNEGGNIELIANATPDEGKNITKVEFIVNGSVLLEDTTAPYKQNWVPSNTGSYTIQVKAYQDDEKTIESDEITIEVKEVDKSDLTNDVYRLQNVATGQFLTDSGVSATPVTMNDSGEEQEKHWTFVKSGTYYNIDSEAFGILRATGPTFSAGAYAVVSTGKSAPAGDTDKVWTIHYNELDNTFRFESRNNKRYLYHAANGNVTNVAVDDTNTEELNRTKWKAISTSASLSISDTELKSPSIKIYPNPAEDKFTIAFNNINTVKRVDVFNILGRLVYQNSPKRNILEVESNGFEIGVYLVKVFSIDNKVFHSKLIIK